MSILKKPEQDTPTLSDLKIKNRTKESKRSSSATGNALTIR